MSAGHHVGQEVLLSHGNLQAVEDFIQGGSGAPAADEHFEVPFQGVAQGAHYLVLYQLDFIVDREGLGYGPVHNLLFGVGQGIGFQGDGLKALHLFVGNVVVGIGALDAGAGGNLFHFAAGHAHHHLQDADHELVLGLLNGILELLRGLHGIGDEAGADAFRGRFAVVNNLDVVSVHPSHAKPEFGGSQVD